MAQRSIGKQRIMGDRQTEGSEVAQSPNRSQKPPFPFPGHLQGHRRYEKERERFTGMQTRAASGYLRIERPPFSYSRAFDIFVSNRIVQSPLNFKLENPLVVSLVNFPLSSLSLIISFHFYFFNSLFEGEGISSCSVEGKWGFNRWKNCYWLGREGRLHLEGIVGSENQAEKSFHS